jgi:hypothetical protein
VRWQSGGLEGHGQWLTVKRFNTTGLPSRWVYVQPPSYQLTLTPEGIVSVPTPQCFFWAEWRHGYALSA